MDKLLGLVIGALLRELFFAAARVLVAEDARRVTQGVRDLRGHRPRLPRGPRRGAAPAALLGAAFAALLTAVRALREHRERPETKHVAEEDFHARDHKYALLLT